MNIVIVSRILEITEKKTRFQRIKNFSSIWKSVVLISLTALTLKVAAEQIAMMILRHQ